MSENLVSIVLNQLLGAVIGTITSIGISWYFYKKSDVFNRVAGERLNNMERMEIERRLGKIYEFSLWLERPKKPDIPYIARIWLDHEKIKPGSTCSMLFYVADSGFNFPGSSGLEVIESTSQLTFPTIRQGHGYYSCEVKFARNAPPGTHTVLFTLRDAKNNINKQSIKVDVLPRTRSVTST